MFYFVVEVFYAITIVIILVIINVDVVYYEIF